MTKREIRVMAVSACLLAAAAAPAVAADGWAVRICRGFTEASKIKIEVGEPGKHDQLLVNWKSDDTATEFALPATLKDAKKVHVAADSEPADGTVSMCVLYAGKPAKSMAFNDLLEATVAQGDADPKCQCPK